MDIKKIIFANRIFIIIQAVAFFIDIIFSFVFDINVYFLFAWFVGVAVILYNGFIQSVFTYKFILKNKMYSGVVRKHLQIPNLRIYNLAKKTKDYETKKVLEQGYFSIIIMLLNFVYVLVITIILHPENIG